MTPSTTVLFLVFISQPHICLRVNLQATISCGVDSKSNPKKGSRNEEVVFLQEREVRRSTPEDKDERGMISEGREDVN